MISAFHPPSVNQQSYFAMIQAIRADRVIHTNEGFAPPGERPQTLAVTVCTLQARQFILQGFAVLGGTL